MTKPYEWTPYLEKALLDLDQVPLLGENTHFDKEAFLAFFASTLNLDATSLEWTPPRWLQPEDFWEDLGGDFVLLNFALFPLQGRATLILPSVDILKLATLLLNKASPFKTLLNTQFEEGFCRFLGVHFLHILEKMHFFKGGTYKLLKTTARPTEPGLVEDLTLTLGEERVNARLIISHKLQQEWARHHAQATPQIDRNALLDWPLTCHLEATRFPVTRSEWEQFQLGDFIPLSNCLWGPGAPKERLYITLREKPLLKLRPSKEGFKILEYPFDYEEVAPMDTSDFENPEEELNEELLEASLDQEPEEQDPLEKSALEPPVHPQEIPLTVIVELKRLEMSAQKLFQLTPGNLIELDLDPNTPVNLVVNGKTIGRGELLRIGETLGIRLLEKG